MKYLLYIIAFLFTSNILAQEFNWEEIDKDINNIIDSERTRAENLLNFRTSEINNNYDIKYHKLAWTVDPEEYYIDGKVTTTFTPTQPDMQYIEFDLYKELTVESVSFNGSAVTFELLDNDILKIRLNGNLIVDEPYDITIKYKGTPNSGGFGSFNTGSTKEFNNPILWTLSEPYGARDWWPCKQNLNDKIDSIDVIVTCPSEYRVASNGVLIEETTHGNNKTFHWKHRHPIPAYLIAIAVTKYEVYSDWVPVQGHDDIEVLNYVFPESFASAKNSTPNIIPVMQMFNELFGLYPFADEKYGHAQFLWGGGMEHQTMSFMVNFSNGLMAHELAHQWFGDMVTCGSWEDLWLNESFATYLTGLTNLYLGSDEQFRNWKVSTMNNVTSKPDGSVFVPDTTNIGRLFAGRLTYRKGALVLDGLRHRIGDDAFFSGVRNYLNEKKFDYARTSDLIQHLEATSEQDLTSYFDHWFWGEGYPSYNIDVNLNQNGNSVTINQVQSHTSVDFFDELVPIQFSGEDQDTILYFMNTENHQTFNFDLPFTVESSTFDPNVEIISRDNNLVVATNEIDWNSNEVTVGPNPGHDFLQITNTNSPIQSIKLIDLTSHQVLKSIDLPNGGKIDISDLAKGLYFLEIQKEGYLIGKKVLKL